MGYKTKPPINDRETQERLVRDNLGLIHAVCRRYKLAPTDDRVSDGLLGLWRAARHFDASLGWQFSSYAWRSIERELHTSHKKEFRHERRVAAATERELVRAADAERYRSGYHDVEPDELDWSALNDRERGIIEMRAGGMTLDEVGALLGISKERVRQVQAIALGKLGVGK